MILRSSYTQSVFSVYPIYTEDIIERYLIKSVNVSGGSASRTGRDVRQVGVRAARAEMWDRWEGWEGWDEWDRWDGRVLIKILAIEKKILPLLKVKNILYRENEYRATTSIK